VALKTTDRWISARRVGWFNSLVRAPRSPNTRVIASLQAHVQRLIRAAGTGHNASCWKTSTSRTSPGRRAGNTESTNCQPPTEAGRQDANPQTRSQTQDHSRVLTKTG
jgi:hypothetical protein